MKDNYEKARKDYFEFYSNRHKEMADAYPGILEILEFIKSKNIPVSIYTGKGRKSSEITLKKTGLYDFFDMIVTGDDIQGCKPSPEGITKFAVLFNIDPKKIEDKITAKTKAIRVAIADVNKLSFIEFII